MGLFDKFTKILGGGKPDATEAVKGPSQVLREQGIDPSNLKFRFHSSGSIAVSGNVESQAECDSICKALEDMPNVSSVQNNMVIAAAQPEPEPVPDTVTESAPEATPEVAESTEAAPAEAGAEEARTYTVKPGDTLSAIAREFYGSGSKYMKIFNANTHILDNPDRIKPGQVLNIPD